MQRLVLASASPRRQELVRSVGLTFVVDPADVDEREHVGETPVDYVARRDDRAVVLAADTTVDVDGAILGKPADDDDARRMLRLMSGRTHLVHTAIVCASRAGVVSDVVTTAVTFTPLTERTLDRYLALGEHRDKAGAYGIQGAAGAFVERIHGSPTNVIGLPLAQTIVLLRSAGIVVAS
jgi:septum formation protein